MKYNGSSDAKKGRVFQRVPQKRQVSNMATESRKGVAEPRG